MKRASLCLLLLLLGSVSQALVVDGTAASVGKRLITIHDAYIYRALQRFLAGKRPAILIETGDDLKQTVQKLVFEEMVYLEMKSFEFDGGPKADAVKLVDSAKRRREADWKAILNRFDITSADAIDRVYRSLQVERFLQKRIETLTPIITDAEVEKYYEANAARFKGTSLEALKPSIILLLKKRRMQKGLEDWVEYLKQKYGVQSHLEG